MEWIHFYIFRSRKIKRRKLYFGRSVELMREGIRTYNKKIENIVISEQQQTVAWCNCFDMCKLTWISMQDFMNTDICVKF